MAVLVATCKEFSPMVGEEDSVHGLLVSTQLFRDRPHIKAAGQ